MPDDGYYDDAPSTANFLLAVDGVEIGRFGQVRGLEVTVNAEEYTEGGVNGYTHRLPGRATWPNVVLKRGVTQSDALFEWMSRTVGDGFSAAGNKVERCTGAITILGQDGTMLRSWELEGVFPVAWRGPELAADSAAGADEELELAHHGFRSVTKKR